jgi:crossover junction endodeoxyribonuclease RuvC
MKIIGIDPGTAATGYGIINGAKLIEYGVIKTQPTQTAAQRLRFIYQELKRIIRFHKPDQAVVEDIFLFRNQKSVVRVSQVVGIILLCAEEFRIPTFQYAPLQIKQLLTGYGRASKEELQKLIKKEFGLKEIPNPTHAADALAIALCHLTINTK